MVPSKPKGKHKILVEEESETEEEKDIDATIEEVIRKNSRMEDRRKKLQKLIVTIIAEKPSIIPPSTTTPKKSSMITPKVCNERKGAQSSRSAATSQIILPTVEEVIGLPQTSPCPSQKKKKQLLHNYVHQRKV